MENSEGKPKISRRTFLKIAGLGAAAAGVAGAAALASKLGMKDIPVPPIELTKQPQKEFLTAKDLLGEGYKVTRLDPEGIDPSKEPPYIFDITSVGGGSFENLEDARNQKGYFYLSGKREDSFPTGANVSMQVSIYESQDGKRKYLVLGIDNATGPLDSRQFTPDSVLYNITYPLPPMRSPSDKEKPVTQKDAEQGGGSISVDNLGADRVKPKLTGDKVSEWETRGYAMFFIEMQDPDRPQAKNLIPKGGEFIPKEMSILLKDVTHNSSLKFTATKRPEK